MTNLRGKNRKSVSGPLRSVCIGAGAAAAATLLLMAVISIVTLILRSITHSSVLPLALAAAGVGCFIGGVICGVLARRRGLLYGALVGLILFSGVWLLGLCFTQPVFGTENAVKLILLVMSGSFGGYIGSRGRCRRR